jgi:hypothetical protein
MHRTPCWVGAIVLPAIFKKNTVLKINVNLFMKTSQEIHFVEITTYDPYAETLLAHNFGENNGWLSQFSCVQK